MLDRLMVRDRESPETARRRFDGQLDVRAWETFNRPMVRPVKDEKPAPWWWSQAEADQSSSFFMDMARARGMV